MCIRNLVTNPQVLLITPTGDLGLNNSVALAMIKAIQVLKHKKHSAKTNVTDKMIAFLFLLRVILWKP